MPTIIRELPFEDRSTFIEVHGQRIPVKAFQAVVWVSVMPLSSEPLDIRIPRIPAVVDLGFNGSFAVRDEQLRLWTGIDPRLLTKRRRTRLRGAPADERAGKLWFHPNVPGARDVSGRPPFAVELDGSFFLLQSPIRDEDDRPRLPLVGVRAFYTAGWEVIADCKRCRLSIRTARRFWLFR